MMPAKNYINPSFQLPDELWNKIEPLIPNKPDKSRGGRPRESDRKMMEAIYYILRTGCQWDALPRCLGASSTVHDRFQEWSKAGVFESLWRNGLIEYDAMDGLDLDWQSMDGAITKAPLGGEATGPNPTDRGKSGVKRSLLTEGGGIPISVTVANANQHDVKLFEATLENIEVKRPNPDNREQHMCLDKGYDSKKVRTILDEWGYTAHIRSRGEEKQTKKEIPGYRSRRWVVERTHSWMNRFRRLHVRWEKKEEHYIAMVHLSCAFITLRALGVFG